MNIEHFTYWTPRFDIIHVDIIAVTFSLVADGGGDWEGGAGAAQRGGRAGGGGLGAGARGCQLKWQTCSSDFWPSAASSVFCCSIDCNYVERNLLERHAAESLLNKMYSSLSTFFRFSFGLDSFTDLLSGGKDVSYFLLQALFSFSSILTVIVVGAHRAMCRCVPL